MATTYKLVGYDRATEFLIERHPIPAALAAQAREAAAIRTDGSDARGDWPLTDQQARSIAALIGARIDLARCQYMFEPYAEARGTS